MPDSLSLYLERVHAAPHRMVMAFAGAGAQALAWLHGVGGSSRTVLEATDHYAPASLLSALHFTPMRFASAQVAAHLAETAYRRARELRALERATYPVFGLGLSATIATDRDKRGEHRAAVAVRDSLGVVTYQVALHKGARSRNGEEEVVSLMALRAVSEACGLGASPAPPLLPGETLAQDYDPVPELARLWAGETPWVRLDPSGPRLAGGALPGLAILSGSFNPLHAGHRALARAAAETLARPVAFELSLENADKPAILLPEARRRALQFAGDAPLLLTRAARFGDKARLFPGSVFVVGADTAARLVAPRFYADSEARRDAALGHLAALGARFLVAARSEGKRVRTLDDLTIPAPYRSLFEALPRAAFHMDISSSALRAAAPTGGLKRL